MPLSQLEQFIHASHRKDVLMASIGNCKLAISAIVLPLLFAIWPAALHSQSCCPDFRLELLKPNSWESNSDSDCWSPVPGRQGTPERPGLQCPAQRRRLAFHKHIIKDDHYLVTNCALCRKYLKQIKSYSKKIDQAMK